MVARGMACAGLAQCSSSWSLEGIHGQVVCPHCSGLAPLMDTPQPNRFRKSCAPPPAEASKVGRGIQAQGA